MLRDLQHAFRRSKTFAPLLRQTENQERQNKSRSKRRRLDNDNAFKMGHGGTLDPMATGVLIVGIGRGTKSLQQFIDCTKTYETVVLFGKSTDTYDVAGKVVAVASTSQISRDMVEKKLEGFRGNIKQVPPIYSALKIDGMKAYDYARSGKELPRELTARDMKVDECSLIDWYEPGEHDYRWPAEEVSSEEKAIFGKLVDKTKDVTANETPIQPHKSEPRHEPVEEIQVQTQPQGSVTAKTADSTGDDHRAWKAQQHTHDLTGLSDMAASAPAARIRLTVSSGFYVRSFAHDLGLSCGSYGTMAELVRSRQGAYSIHGSGDQTLIPAVQYSDLDKGEDIWSPTVIKVLSEWLAQAPSKEEISHSRLDRTGRPSNNNRSRDKAQNFHKRRNSSSPE